MRTDIITSGPDNRPTDASASLICYSITWAMLAADLVAGPRAITLQYPPDPTKRPFTLRRLPGVYGRIAAFRPGSTGAINGLEAWLWAGDADTDHDVDRVPEFVEMLRSNGCLLYTSPSPRDS